MSPNVRAIVSRMSSSVIVPSKSTTRVRSTTGVTLVDVRGGRPGEPREHDAGADHDSAHGLQRPPPLGEDDDREDRAEERLQIRVERGAGRAHTVDGGEPEDIRDEEREDEPVEEPRPRERIGLSPVLGDELVGCSDEERHAADEEDDSADAVRRVAAHERRDGDAVAGPRRRGRKPEEDAAELARYALRRPGRDEPNAGEGEECGQVVAGPQARLPAPPRGGG